MDKEVAKRVLEYANMSTGVVGTKKRGWWAGGRAGSKRKEKEGIVERHVTTKEPVDERDALIRRAKSLEGAISIELEKHRKTFLVTLFGSTVSGLAALISTFLADPIGTTLTWIAGGSGLAGIILNGANGTVAYWALKYRFLRDLRIAVGAIDESRLEKPETLVAASKQLDKIKADLQKEAT